MSDIDPVSTFYFLRDQILNLLYGKISGGGDCISPGWVQLCSDVELLDLEKRHIGKENNVLGNAITYPVFSITIDELIRGELYITQMDGLKQEDPLFAEQLNTNFDQIIELTNIYSELTTEQATKHLDCLKVEIINFNTPEGIEFKAA
jgi:hypothetical protein